jgi:hypothetical protein
MPTKIVWMSRHAPTATQLVELARLFPAHDLHFDPAPFSDADEIVKRFHALGADEMVVVAPWTVIRAITKRGIRPIYAEMAQIPCSSAHEVSINSGRKRRCYRFVKFHRCSSVKLELSDITPPAAAAD